MIPFALLAAAAAIQSPPGVADADIPGMVTLAEYPVEARAAGRSAAATIELRVDTDGRPQACRVVAVLGDSALARDICAIAAAKRYNPARLRDGTPAFAVVTTMVRLYVPGPATAEIAAARMAPAADVRLAGVPGNAASEDVTLVTAVDARGVVIQCGPKREEQRNLAEAICTQAKALRPAVVRDAAGTPMPYISETLVRARAGAR
ncbi:energy transducer TonB [Novosphingobium huizhouense]|uniref:energy transducer TonB n=1 Tax=Novosphingobium huizhouense TaxID=2866625 RepID=UPI001CD89305|nr:energy transducer TonB [Novosphingobium huizhouense]